MNINTKSFQLIFWFSLLAETALLTFFNRKLGVISPVIYTFSVIFGFWALLRIYDKGNNVFTLFSFKPIVPKLKWIIILNIILTFLFLYYCNYIFINNTVSPNQSDIIPSLHLYVERFLSGTYPYEPMEFGWTVKPNYFSMRWLPFIFPELLSVDYRWLPVILYLIIFFLIVFQTKFWRNNSSFFYLSIFHWILWLLLFKYQLIEFYLSIEFLIISVYLFLAIALFYNNWFLIAIAISLCLFTRQSIVFLLPAMFIYIQSNFGFKKLLFTIFIILAFGFITMFPFLYYDKGASFLLGLEYYKIGARGIWNLFEWQTSDDIPYHISHGMSYAIWWSVWYKENSQLAFDSFYTFQWVIGVLISGFMAILAFIKKTNIHLILIIKLYLGLFYNTFSAPFQYLYFLPWFYGFLVIMYVKRKDVV